MTRYRLALVSSLQPLWLLSATQVVQVQQSQVIQSHPLVRMLENVRLVVHTRSVILGQAEENQIGSQVGYLLRLSNPSFLIGQDFIDLQAVWK